MERYLFYCISGGYKLYYTAPGCAISDRNKAALFTNEDWDKWGRAQGVEREDTSGYEEMRRAGVPTLPGLEQTQ